MVAEYSAPFHPHLTFPLVWSKDHWGLFSAHLKVLQSVVCAADESTQFFSLRMSPPLPCPTFQNLNHPRHSTNQCWCFLPSPQTLASGFQWLLWHLGFTLDNFKESKPRWNFKVFKIAIFFCRILSWEWRGSQQASASSSCLYVSWRQGMMILVLR